MGDIGCPIGRSKGKCGCSLKYSKKSLNIKKKGRQEKRKRLCDYYPEEIQQVFNDEEEDRREIQVIKLER